MKTLYKALASVGMIALSTAAALTVRHLAKKRKNQNNTASETQTDNDIAAQTENETAENETAENEDDSVVTSDTEIKPDLYNDSDEATDSDDSAEDEEADVKDDEADECIDSTDTETAENHADADDQ